MPEPDNGEDDGVESHQSIESNEPEIVLRMDDDDAKMVEQILSDGGVKSDVIRRE